MKSAAELSRVLATLPPVPVAGSFARRVRLADLLGIKAPVDLKVAVMTVRIPNFLWVSPSEYRYNPSNVPTFYVGEGESTAAAETKQHPGLTGFDFKPTEPDSLFHIETILSSVLDVTDPATIAALGTTEKELLAPWRLKSPKAPTQILGAAVHTSSRFEAIRYRSARKADVGETGYCLAIFQDRKFTTSTVRVFDPSGTFNQQW